MLIELSFDNCFACHFFKYRCGNNPHSCKLGSDILNHESNVEDDIPINCPLKTGKFDRTNAPTVIKTVTKIVSYHEMNYN